MNWQEVKNFFETQILEAQEQYLDIRSHIWNRCIGIVSRKELDFK